jgi:signal transduction histidine kinase
MPDVSDRLRALLDAGIALNAELSLDALLQRLVESAAEITGAGYAALGVIDKSGRTLERFLTTGIDAERHAAIGELPRGRGILGVLIREARALRLDDIGADPRSVGFPRNHPPMKSFLGLPIMLRGVAYGNLYLTEKEGDDQFTDEDLELTQLLAAQAAVAIENARLYESTTRWLRQFETLNEIGNALASEVELTPLLELVSRRLRELLDAGIVLIALPGPGAELVVAAADGDGTYGLPGMSLDLDHSKMGRVLERGRSERVDSVLEDPEVDQKTVRRLGVHAGLYIPLVIGGQAIGVVVAHDRAGPDPRFSDDDLRLAETLAARAATGVDLSQRVSRDAVRRVVEAQELERKRLARELHDETGQALTSILLGLKPLEEGATQQTLESVAALRELVVSTLQGVRRLAVELRPSALDDLGLVPAIDRLAHSFGESGIQVDVESQIGEERLPEVVETTLYRIVQEAATNVAKHAGAQRMSITLTRRDGSVIAIIEDDGKGFDPGAAESDGLGLLGMRERLALVGGSLRIEAAPGTGTTIAAEVPIT